MFWAIICPTFDVQVGFRVSRSWYPIMCQAGISLLKSGIFKVVPRLGFSVCVCVCTGVTKETGYALLMVLWFVKFAGRSSEKSGAPWDLYGTASRIELTPKTRILQTLNQSPNPNACSRRNRWLFHKEPRPR